MDRHTAAGSVGAFKVNVGYQEKQYSSGHEYVVRLYRVQRKKKSLSVPGFMT